MLPPGLRTGDHLSSRDHRLPVNDDLPGTEALLRDDAHHTRKMLWHSVCGILALVFGSAIGLTCLALAAATGSTPWIRVRSIMLCKIEGRRTLVLRRYHILIPFSCG